MENRVNQSYLWAWDDKQGWNYTTYFSFFNEFGRDNEDLKYVEFGLILFLCLCSLLINVVLILFFLVKKELRTEQNMYTVNIMLSSVVLLPFAMLIGSTRLSDEGWMFGGLACQTTLYVLVATAFVKIWLMTLISVDRYLRVVHSHNRYIGRKLSIILMVIAWILPAATLAGMVYPNSEYKYIPDVYDGVTICTVAFKYSASSIPNSLLYFITIFSIEFLLPTTIMVTCYVLIMRRISRSTAKLLKHANQTHKKLTLSSKSVDKGLRSNMRRRRTTVILITIMVLFLVMWTPLFVLLAGVTLDQMLETFGLSSSWVIAQVCILLLNTLIEPFLYSFTTSKARTELKRTLQKLRPCKVNSAENKFVVDETSTQLHSTDSTV